jgi:NifU-like protein
MNFYPPKVNEKFSAPQNVGKLENEDAMGAGATFVCGAVLRLYLQIDVQSKEILEAKFQTNGCGFSIASAEVLANQIVGKQLIELHGFDDNTARNDIQNELGNFEMHRRHCLDLALNALRNAFADFRVRQIEEFNGEKALICTCFGVSEETIEDLIKTKALESVEQVTDACKAGGGCGSCQPLIQEIIDVIRLEEI